MTIQSSEPPEPSEFPIRLSELDSLETQFELRKTWDTLKAHPDKAIEMALEFQRLYLRQNNLFKTLVKKGDI